MTTNIKLTPPQRALLMACHAAGNRFIPANTTTRSGYRVSLSLGRLGLVQWGRANFGADVWRVKLTKEGRALARALDAAKGGAR